MNTTEPTKCYAPGYTNTVVVSHKKNHTKSFPLIKTIHSTKKGCVAVDFKNLVKKKNRKPNF